MDNLWATHGSGSPVLVLLGHTDVVPPGPREAWASDPFEPTIRDGVLYGRGAADMKGSVAAFVVALEALRGRASAIIAGTVALLLTSDEEGDAIDGVRRVADDVPRDAASASTGASPASRRPRKRLGDLLRVGRRGTLSGTLTVRGIQGHVAYPEKARNPIHQAAPALAELTRGNGMRATRKFSADSACRSRNIHAGTGANNVIPGELQVVFNFRYNPGWRAEPNWSAKCMRCSTRMAWNTHPWHRGGEPFLTAEGALRKVAREVMIERCGGARRRKTPAAAPRMRASSRRWARKCVEMGPVNASIHKVDERVSLDELAAVARALSRNRRKIVGSGELR